MTLDDEQRQFLNKQLLLAARQGGDLDEWLEREECRDENENYLFDINCTDVFGNTPLHLAVKSGEIENVHALINAEGCDVDLQNSDWDTPLHLAIQIQDKLVRREIIEALVQEAGAYESLKLTNKAGQTPRDLYDIYCRGDEESLTAMTPKREVRAMIDADDIASDGEDGPGSESE